MDAAAALLAALQSPLPFYPALTILEAVGALVLARLAASLALALLPSAARRHALAPGDWAVVTGATDGIGKAYAEHLLKKGLNVLVVARSAERVRDTVAELLAQRREGAAQAVEGHVADFSQPGIYADLGKALAGKSVGILVNNVGMSYPFPLLFEELGGACAPPPVAEKPPPTPFPLTPPLFPPTTTPTPPQRRTRRPPSART